MLLEAASLKSFAHSLIYEYLGKTGVKLADFCGDIIGALLIYSSVLKSYPMW